MHEVESMFSARVLPWHFGDTKDRTIITDNVLTAEQAIKDGGLDWDVVLKELWVASAAGKYKKVPGTFAVERSTDERVLGVVKSKYTPFQNRQAFTFADNLVDSGDAKYETAGSLRGGKVVFLTMKVPLDLLVNGEDAHELYIVLRTSHDGSKAVSVYLTPIRVVCMNTLSLSFGSSKQRWSVPHISTIEGRLQEARDTLELTHKYAEEFVVMGNQLVATKVTDAMLRDLVDQIMPSWRKKADEVSNSIMALFHDSPTNGYPGTAWGALNAITEFFDHGRDVRSADAAMLSVLEGESAKARQKAYALLASV